MVTRTVTAREARPRGERAGVLEGRSSPDVWLATPRAVVVIEGKRTENGPTTHTSFMGVTTWQLVCERLGIESGVLIDRI